MKISEHIMSIAKKELDIKYPTITDESIIKSRILKEYINIRETIDSWMSNNVFGYFKLTIVDDIEVKQDSANSFMCPIYIISTYYLIEKLCEKYEVEKKYKEDESGVEYIIRSF